MVPKGERVEPILVMLTGPQAWVVGNILDMKEVGQRFNVRDFLYVPQAIGKKLNSLAVDTAEAIMERAGGDKWLADFVLPASSMGEPLHLTCGHSDIGKTFSFQCAVCRKFRFLPSRLAILVECEAPELLIQRVMVWGGEVWRCEIVDMSPAGNHRVQITRANGEWRTVVRDDWEKVVEDIERARKSWPKVEI